MNVDRRIPFDRILTQECAIYRVTASKNDNYEVIPGDEVLVADDVPCFGAFPSGRKNIIPAGLDPSKTRVFYFKHGQDVKERDVILKGGRRYMVTAVDGAGLDEHHLEAYCETVLGG